MLGLTLVGAIVLLLPFSHSGGGFAPIMDAIFAATSATTTTGLSTQDVTTFWTLPGQVTILVLTFLGGLGFTVAASLLLLRAGRRMASALDEDTGDAPSLGNGKRLALRIAIIIVGIQLLGFIALLARFSFVESMSDAVPRALTTTILGFNNAGFIDLLDVGEGEALGADWGTLAIFGVLAVLGAVGCIVLLDIGRKRRPAKLSLNTKFVLAMTGLIALLGTAAILAFEFDNSDTIGDLALADKVSFSAFEAIAGRTSGITTVDHAETEQHTSLLMMGLMLVGGASASTAGGIKVNTLTVLLVAVLAALGARRGTSMFQRELSFVQVKHAMTLCILMLGLTLLAVILITLLERGHESPFIDMMFEMVSAVSSAGLSTGLSSELSGWGKLVMTLAMFAGRVLTLTAALLMIGNLNRVRYSYAVERVTIG